MGDNDARVGLCTCIGVGHVVVGPSVSIENGDYYQFEWSVYVILAICIILAVGYVGGEEGV